MYHRDNIFNLKIKFADKTGIKWVVDILWLKCLYFNAIIL